MFSLIFFFYEKVTGLIHLDDPGFIKDRVSVGSWREAMAHSEPVTSER